MSEMHRPRNGQVQAKAIKSITSFTSTSAFEGIRAEKGLLARAAWVNAPFARKNEEHQELGVSVVLHGHELRLSLPMHPSLSFASARARPDVRLQLASLHVCTAPDSSSCRGQQVRPNRGNGPSSRRLAGAVCSRNSRVAVAGVPVMPAGVLLLTYFMFPDQVGPLIRGLAWPGAAALTLPMLGRVNARKQVANTHARSHADAGAGGGLDVSAVGQGGDIQGSAETAAGVARGLSWRTCKEERGWLVAARVAQEYAGSAAVLRMLGLSWLYLAPASASIAQACLGLAAVMVEYNAVGRRQRRGVVQPGPAAELAWRDAHKRAAQRLAQHLPRDMPTAKAAPLSPVLDVLERLSFRATAVGGHAHAAVGTGMGGGAVGQGMWGGGVGMLCGGDGQEAQAARLACLGGWAGADAGGSGSLHPWSMRLPPGGPVLALSMPLGGRTPRVTGTDKQGGHAPQLAHMPTSAVPAPPATAAAAAAAPNGGGPGTVSTPFSKAAASAAAACGTPGPAIGPQAHARSCSSSSSSSWQPGDSVAYSHDGTQSPCAWQHNLVACAGPSSSPSRTGSAAGVAPSLPAYLQGNPTYIGPQPNEAAAQAPLRDGQTGRSGKEPKHAAPPAPAQQPPCQPAAGAGLPQKPQPCALSAFAAAASPRTCIAPSPPSVPTLSPPSTPPLKTPGNQALSPETSPFLGMPPAVPNGTTPALLPPSQVAQKAIRMDAPVQQQQQQKQQLDELQQKQQLLMQHLLRKQLLRQESRARQLAAQETPQQAYRVTVMEEEEAEGPAHGAGAPLKEGPKPAAAPRACPGGGLGTQQPCPAPPDEALLAQPVEGPAGLPGAQIGHWKGGGVQNGMCLGVSVHQQPSEVVGSGEARGAVEQQGGRGGVGAADEQAQAQKLELLGRHLQQRLLQRQRSRTVREAAEGRTITEDAGGSSCSGTHAPAGQPHECTEAPCCPGLYSKDACTQGLQELQAKLDALPASHASLPAQPPQPPSAAGVSVDVAAAPGGTAAGPLLLGAPHLEHAHPLLQAQQGDTEPLPLFGQADHLDVAPQGPVSWTAACANFGVLSARALYLLAVFSPFLVLGISLLLLAWSCSRKRAMARRRQARLRGPSMGCEEGVQGRQGAASAGGMQQQARQQLQARCGGRCALDARAHKRACTLQQLPANVVAVLSAVEEGGGEGDEGEEGPWLWWLETRSRRVAWSLLLAGCRKSGAALIKWGQWAAARPDLFPADFCSAMSTLQDKAPVHSFAHTKREVEAAFGAPLLTHFSWFDPKPLASGSIAQVHRATVRDPCSSGNVDVVVKVRHPGVATSIHRDFQLLKPLASFASRFRALKGLSLRETVAQFSHTMTAQADLRVEAAHIARFARDFAPVWSQVAVPRLFPGLVTPAVMVESYEPGRSVAHFTRSRTPINTQIVSLGVDAYLAMLLKHNFVHTDLHPGNILVRMHDPATRLALSDEEAGFSSMLAGTASSSRASQSSTSAGTSITSTVTSRERVLAPHAQIVLLDFGLAEELTPRVRRHFVAFLNCIAAGDGVRAAEHILHWGQQQSCPDPRAFITAMDVLFNDICCIDSPKGIDLDQVMKMVLSLASKLEVTIDSSYAALAIGVCVLVGFATSLDPSVNLMDAATPCLLAYALTGRVVGRLYT